ncbi:DUF4344 domain-containing metallopeptidase [Cupriavidus oxalaticus]|nr:DUF4344 domain-containing metallopeptidase [Cupriavidus oxalaticus]
MLQKFFGLATLCLCTTTAFAKIPVEVSPAYAQIVINQTEELPTKNGFGQVVYPTKTRDIYSVKVTTDGPGVTVETYRTQDLDRNDYSKVVRLGEVRGKWSGFVEFPPGETSGKLIFVRPPANGKVKARLEVTRLGTRTVEQRKAIEDFMRIPLDVLDEIYSLPKFKVVVKPCGTVNAFSAPDITICTELIADLFEKDASEALPVMVMHEVGHTLLNLWGMPGWDNEDVVDEFAGSLMVSSRPQAVRAMAKWLRSLDSLSAAALQLSRDERHSIPVQRARNFERLLADAAQTPKGQFTPTQKRWFTLLGDHVKAERREANTTPSVAQPSATTQANAPAEMTVASGVCERLTMAGSDATKLCSNNVLRMKYQSGRSSFVVATTNKVPLAFATGPEERTEGGGSTFAVDTISVWHTSASDMEFLPAHGKCIVRPVGESKILQCDLVTDSNGALHGVQLRFREWEPLH